MTVADPVALLAERWASTELTPAQRWKQTARPEQLGPIGTLLWFVWLILAGRGWGKTRTGAEWAAAKARRYPGVRIALVAATFADGRDTMVEGESGLLSVIDDAELRGGSQDAAWNRSLGELYLANGSRFKIYSSEKPRQLRGPQHHFAWADEIAQWNDARLGTAKDTTWSNLVIGTRLPRRKGWDEEYRSQIVATTTPRPVALLKTRDEQNPGLLQRTSTAVTAGRTTDNLANLSDTYRQEVVDPLLGTRLGAQELDAVLLEDVEGALFSAEQIEADRVLEGDLPGLDMIVVAVDPSNTAGPTADEAGIVVVARGVDGQGYVLDDRSGRMGPTDWAAAAWEAALEWGAETIVIEEDGAQDNLMSSMKVGWQSVAFRFRRAGAVAPRLERAGTKGQSKRTRAVPVGLLYEQHKVHHIQGRDPDALFGLESEMTTWDGTGDSPNRVDALTWGIRYIFRIGVEHKTITTQPRWQGRRAWR